VARIRTIKPELWSNDKVCTVTLPAVLTFIGLISHADDEGRHTDKARSLKGLIWAERDEITWQDVEDHLQQLEQAGLICRYAGCDGKAYLHLVGWFEHQKISHPTPSRYAACPTHPAPGPAQSCGRCQQVHSLAPEQPGHRNEPTTPPIQESAIETAGQGTSPEPLQRTPEPLAPGSGIKDLGSSPYGDGFAAPPLQPPTPPRGQTAQEMVAWYTGTFATDRQPSREVRGHLGKIIKSLLDQGVAPDRIHAGLLRYWHKPLSPSVLPSMVHEADNPRAAAVPAARQPHHAWTNPANADAYAGSL